MRTGVIIVSYHSNADTDKLVKQFISEDCFDYICVVVNDAKNEDVRFFDQLKSEKVVVLFNKDNLGYAKGNNVGFKHLIDIEKCDVIAISNNDVAVKKQSVEYLCERLYKNRKYGALAPVMLDSKGNRVPLRYLDLGYLRLFLRIFVSETSLDAKYQNKLKAHDGIIEQTFLPGSFFAVNSKAMQEAGLFDENTFLYREEEILGKRFERAGHKEGVLVDIYYQHNHKYHSESVANKKKSLKMALDSEKYYFFTYVCNTRFEKIYVLIEEKLFYFSRSFIWRVEQMAKSIYAVLVEWGGVELTIDCIESLQKSNINNLKIIVVDNCSSDNSLEIIQQYASDKVIILSAKHNNGFSSGNNIGIKYALQHDADYIMLLNNDTVVDPGMVQELINNSKGKYITVPKIYYYSNPDTIWFAGGQIDYKRGRFYHIGENKKDSNHYEKKRPVDFATGCCLMIPKTVMEQTGLLYEPFFMYCEDVEYSLRASRKGISIIYCPKAKLWHKVSSTSRNKSKMSLYYGNRNRLYILKMYNFPLTAWVFTLVTRFIYCLRGLVTHGDERIIGKAIRDYYKGVQGKVVL